MQPNSLESVFELAKAAPGLAHYTPVTTSVTVDDVLSEVQRVKFCSPNKCCNTIKQSI